MCLRSLFLIMALDLLQERRESEPKAISYRPPQLSIRKVLVSRVKFCSDRCLLGVRGARAALLPPALTWGRARVLSLCLPKIITTFQGYDLYNACPYNTQQQLVGG